MRGLFAGLAVSLLLSGAVWAEGAYVLSGVGISTNTSGETSVTVASGSLVPYRIIEQSPEKAVLEFDRLDVADTVKTDFQGDRVSHLIFQPMPDQRVRLVLRGQHLERLNVTFRDPDEWRRQIAHEPVAPSRSRSVSAYNPTPMKASPPPKVAASLAADEVDQTLDALLSPEAAAPASQAVSPPPATTETLQPSPLADAPMVEAPRAKVQPDPLPLPEAPGPAATGLRIEWTWIALWGALTGLITALGVFLNHKWRQIKTLRGSSPVPAAPARTMELPLPPAPVGLGSLRTPGVTPPARQALQQYVQNARVTPPAPAARPKAAGPKAPAAQPTPAPESPEERARATQRAQKIQRPSTGFPPLPSTQASTPVESPLKRPNLPPKKPYADPAIQAPQAPAAPASPSVRPAQFPRVTQGLPPAPTPAPTRPPVARAPMADSPAGQEQNPELLAFLRAVAERMEQDGRSQRAQSIQKTISPR